MRACQLGVVQELPDEGASQVVDANRDIRDVRDLILDGGAGIEGVRIVLKQPKDAQRAPLAFRILHPGGDVRELDALDVVERDDDRLPAAEMDPHVVALAESARAK